MASILDIGQQIRRARKARGLSAIELAELAGIHRNTLLALETGKGNIELNRLLAICGELKIELLLVPQQVAQMRGAEAAATPADSSTELSQQLSRLMQKEGGQ
ncbi:helix-turn-helix domain-containing protein [Herbaspirillum lusitanum]|jgi:transcriptional regulator with XRE-family HTH domain|uniref:Helix-turn-helix domain-containing protein n=1 Tax=Herbaspirillum lusitanum TaxID=213312 RepID=A0ABW9ACI1_9BURK